MYEIEIDDIGSASAPSGAAPSSWSAIDPALVERLSDADLDELPFGVICLGADGVILRYNLAEARLARLDRSRVLGKNFFRQIAPCTAVPEFQGRVEDFLRSPGGEVMVQRFSFLFDFKFGAQLVTVEMVRPQAGGSIYLLINRDQQLPVRPEAEAPAPLLGELEGEAPPGVLRDERAGRFVRLPAVALQGLFRAAGRAPSDPPALFREWGMQWGRLAAVELETQASEALGSPLRSLRLGDAMRQICAAFRAQGWGELSIDFEQAAPLGAVVARVERSVFIESLFCLVESRHGFTEGYLSAIFSYLSGRKLAARRAPSDPEVGLYVIVDERRLPALDRAFEGSPGSLEALLDGFARETAR